MISRRPPHTTHPEKPVEDTYMLSKTFAKYLVSLPALFILTLILLVANIPNAHALATLTGVVSESGVPISGAAVHIDEDTIIYTAADGTYTHDTTAGSILVTAYTPAGEYIGDSTITLEEGVTSTADFTFTPWIITGIITENGNALLNAEVRAGQNEPITTDGAGFYSTKVQNSTGARISAFTSAGEYIGEQSINNSSVVNLDFAPVTVTGSITENGSPLEGAKVRAWVNTEQLTDETGEYIIRAKPGFARVFAYTSNDEFIGEQMIMLAAGKNAVINFDFNPVTITGTVTENGLQAAGVNVQVGANLPVITDSTGQYSTRAQADTWRIIAENPSSGFIGEKTVELITGSITVDIP